MNANPRAKFFVDTNILMYAHDRSIAAKHQRAAKLVEELWASGAGVVSTQVLQELCVNIRKKSANPLIFNEIRELIEDYLDWEVVENSGESILAALTIEQRFGISFWDALIIHAAETAGAEILYSEDLSANQNYGSVRVVNPFLVPLP